MNKEIQVLLDQYARFVREKNYEAFISQYAPNLVNYDLWQAESYTSLVSWQKNIKEWFEGLGDEYVTVSFREITVYESATTAFLNGIITYQGHSKEGEVLRAMDNRLSWGLICIEDEWKIVHEHTSAPIDFATMNPIFSLPNKTNI